MGVIKGDTRSLDSSSYILEPILGEKSVRTSAVSKGTLSCNTMPILRESSLRLVTGPTHVVVCS